MEKGFGEKHCFPPFFLPFFPLFAKVSGFCLAFIFFFQTTWATPEDVSVLIPLEFRHTASGGLVYQGVEITPEKAVNLQRQGVDISRLDPREGTDIWQNKIGQPLASDVLLLDPQREVEFLNTITDLPGTIEFTVQQNDSLGASQIYVVRVSRKIHNILLRKALLRKIGYIIPPSQHFRQLKVRFGENDPQKRNQFLKQVIWQNLSANPARWISNFYKIQKVQVENMAGELVEQEQYLFLPSGVKRDHPQAKTLAQVNPQEMLLEFQDVLVYPLTNNHVLDLSLGFLPSSVNQNLRLLNSAVVANALTDIPESINKFSWHLGRIKDNFLVLPYEEYSSYSEQYHPNYDDTLWILRRMAQLEREDFVEIVQSANYPDEITSVVQEKLIARRNHLVKILNLEFTELTHKDPSQLNSEHVVKGVVNKNFWTGYGSRFAHSQMDSPLSGTEVFAFFKSKMLSGLLSHLVDKANEALRFTKTSHEWNQRQIQQARKNFINFLKTGELQKTPFGIWTTPTLNGHLTFSREVVTGAYQGPKNDKDQANNMIHLADTFGFSVDAGMLGFLEGLPRNQLANLEGNLFFSRNYTHLKPLRSFKQSLQEPLKHIFVNFYQKDTAQFLEKLEDFTKHFQVGESLIVTDTIGGSVGASVHYGPFNNLELQAQLSDSQVVISRLHIYRADKNTIHVYKDHGNLNSLRLFLGLKSFIPIIGLSFDINNGQAKTLFYRLDITADKSINPFLEDHLRNLKNILLSGSLEMFQKPPVIIKHNFHEDRFGLNLLFLRHTNLSYRDHLTMIHSSGETAEFLRGFLGWRNGQHWQGLGVDVANALIKELWGKDIILHMTDNGNPGDSLKGRSKDRQTYLDSYIKDGTLVESFIQVRHRWKGWEISANEANEIIAEINSWFNHDLFPPQVLANTQRLLLYIINLNIFIYEPAIEHLLEVSEEQAQNFLPTYTDSEDPHEISVLEEFRRNQSICKWRRMKNMKEALEPCIKIVDLVEENVRSTKGLIAFFGSKKNFRIEAKIFGYREGDETTYEPIASHVFGEVGAVKPLGPIMQVLRHPDFQMNQGEFFISWLMGNL